MDTDTLSLLIISLPPPLLCRTDGACKVRAASGLSAIRELNSNIRGITTIFRTIMTFLADKWGYDPQSLVAMPYDWRLSPDLLQRRDRFFSTLKAKVETAVAANDVSAAAFTAMRKSVFVCVSVSEGVKE